jgi:hypothetical protein
MKVEIFELRNFVTSVVNIVFSVASRSPATRSNFIRPARHSLPTLLMKRKEIWSENRFVSSPQSGAVLSDPCQVGMFKETTGHVSARLGNAHMLIRGRGPKETGLLFTKRRDVIAAVWTAAIRIRQPGSSLPTKRSFTAKFTKPDRTRRRSSMPIRPQSFCAV